MSTSIRPEHADSDLTEAQKHAFLETLWSIIVAFVDVGFGVHPLQQVCGEPTEPNHLSETWHAQCDKDKGTSEHHQPKWAESFATAFASAHQQNQERRQK